MNLWHDGVGKTTVSSFQHMTIEKGSIMVTNFSLCLTMDGDLFKIFSMSSLKGDLAA